MHVLLYHATMVIEFDCIVVICALLISVPFLLFSLIIILFFFFYCAALFEQLPVVLIAIG